MSWNVNCPEQMGSDNIWRLSESDGLTRGKCLDHSDEGRSLCRAAGGGTSQINPSAENHNCFCKIKKKSPLLEHYVKWSSSNDIKRLVWIRLVDSRRAAMPPLIPDSCGTCVNRCNLEPMPHSRLPNLSVPAKFHMSPESRPVVICLVTDKQRFSRKWSNVK